MTAALAAYDGGGEVLLIEKSDRYGGSSAMSGGGFWVPNNHLMSDVGIEDNPEDAWTYLRETTAGDVPEDRLRAYLEKAPEMAKYLSEHTRSEFVALPEYADYYQRLPGSRPGGRALEPKNFDASLLEDEFLKMREQNPQMLIMKRIFMTVFEARTMLCRTPGWIGITMRLMAKYWLDLPWRFKSRRDRNLAMGNALVGMLRRSLMDRGIPLWLKTPARELIVEGERVVGVVAEREGRAIRIGAKKGVVLAAGGFEGNQAMREQYLPNPTRAEWSCANQHNTGDAISMGQALGAAVDLMEDAWWGPTTVVPGEDHARMLVIEKSLPGSILVNKAGERFVNEAAPYIDVVNQMYAKDSPEKPCVPAYLVFDATFRQKYPCGRGLEESVQKLNEYARTGEDLDFHRGETVFDRYYGDENVTPNPCLAPIAKPPFYGLEAYPGELGTKGGLKTDANARVLKESGESIPGLYAIGNCSASVMGHSYPGAGSTLGPATTFGYVAAHHAIGN
jgi:3-oxosteroid 1-dehydrogenase